MTSFCVYVAEKDDNKMFALQNYTVVCVVQSFCLP